MARKTEEEEKSGNYGTFEKDGQTRIAASPADAVAWKFDGWTEKSPATITPDTTE